MSAPEPTTGRPHMPGYGIAETAEGALPWRWAAERLTTTRNYWVSTVRPDGRPHTMPVWAVWHEEASVIDDAAVLKPVWDAYKAKYEWDVRGEPMFGVRPLVAFAFVETAEDFSGTATRWTFG